MNTAPITSRDEFLQVLATTTHEIDAFVAREPAYPPWGSLQKQLHAMAEWLAAGGPTAEEQARISIGLIAVRELETAAIPGIDELVNRIYRLQYAWKRWPLAGA